MDRIGRWWRQLTLLALLVTVDLAISLPIMGATYRPFSWMSITPADAATLYPVVRNITRDEQQRPRIVVEVTPGGRYVLQRSTNLVAGGWTDVVTTTAVDQVIVLIDTNPVSRAVFYRVRQLLGGGP